MAPASDLFPGTFLRTKLLGSKKNIKWLSLVVFWDCLVFKVLSIVGILKKKNKSLEWWKKQRHSKLFGWPRSINPIVVYSYKPCGIPASMMILSLYQFILGAINRNGNCFYTRRMLFFKIKTFSNWTLAEDFFLSAEARKNFIKERRSSFVASQISRKQENFYTYMKKQLTDKSLF